MITKPAIAGCDILRGQFCIEREPGRHFPQPSLEGYGGIARRAYSEWPPQPIREGEEFEMMLDGGALCVVGEQKHYLELRDGYVRIELLTPSKQADVRQALYLIAQGGQNGN